ncbi:hypothetical protein [Geobacillus sp. TFV-3]|uniref:hypothetical protein n=1 Tax=Geobacillus sp. TFV-3 TaxID=1897059 RepID=UPI0013576778|nr:hypothetical protein [Geobacillus sp. TFV-3]
MDTSVAAIKTNAEWNFLSKNKRTASVTAQTRKMSNNENGKTAYAKDHELNSESGKKNNTIDRKTFFKNTFITHFLYHLDKRKRRMKMHV